MNRITIREQDLTTPEVGSLSSTDVVYVPGFSSVLNANRTVEPNVPTLCRTITEFEAAFGTEPAVFATAQAYPSGASGFAAAAIPTVGGVAQNMFAVDDPDPSYIYAKELITAGIPVLYERLNEYANTTEAGENTYDVTVANFYAKVEVKFNKDNTDPACVLVEKGEYQFKYLTTGGYPSFEYKTKTLTERMADLCEKRGDAVALIDHTNNPGRVLSGTGSVYDNAKNSTYALTNASYASMFTPWATYNLVASYGTMSSLVEQDLPGSFAYLKTLAASLRNNPNWLVIAGVSRGKVPSLTKPDTNNILTNSIADSYQSDTGVTSINAITNITPYGQCIMGNRTLLDTSSQSGLIATSYLNIRNIASDIKKQLYLACKSLLFEQNTDILWCDFLSMVTPLLDNMQSGHGIAGYRVNKSSESTRTKIVAVVTIYPVYAVESFDITVVLRDDELSTTEE